MTPSPQRRRPRKGGRKSAPLLPPPAEVRIDALGADGDGLARHPDGVALYVQAALPGERVLATPRAKAGDGFSAELTRLLSPAPDRVDPPCAHADACGGCPLMHQQMDAQARTKRDWVVQALARRGFETVKVAETLALPFGHRRRMELVVRRGRLGLTARRDDRVVEIGTCLAVRPGLNTALTLLRDRLAAHLGEARLRLTESATGVDLSVSANFDPDLALREALAEIADLLDLARVSWSTEARAPEPVAERRPPAVTFSGTAVTLPPGPFLQASQAAEAALTALVVDWADGPKKALDLHAGLGPFTLALAAGGSQVRAVDISADALARLNLGAGRAGRGGLVETEARDLHRRPLEPDELTGWDCVVFDPPRAGAEAQAKCLAASAVRRLVSVSCNPRTFARDARILVDGGYRLDRVQPVDAFPMTASVELVALFTRPDPT